MLPVPAAAMAGSLLNKCSIKTSVIKLALLMLTVGTEVLRSSHQLPTLQKQIKSGGKHLDSISEPDSDRYLPTGEREAGLNRELLPLSA